ncbi:MAG TPA: WD40 repeat domain-containing protein, partial [Chloroflexia bacterium]|nr:WD40 repeat domain-containing protein [Chloroflexia bacterium]
TVEVAHEALIRTWGQMRGWLDASRADLRVQRQLHAAAREWQDSGRDASFLAHGARLTQFAALADAVEIALTGEERTFLAASLAARAADAAAEEARRGQELALARSAARRLRSLVAVLAVFLIVAGALAAFAASRQAEAETQRTVAIGAATRAEAQRLAAEAIAAFARADDPEAAALLSIRSLRTALSPEGITALQNAGSAVYPRLHFPAPTGPIIGALFAPDGRTLLTAQADQRVQLWDTTTGQPGAHYALQVTAQTLLGPDAHTAFVAEGPIVHLRELETGRELQQFAGDPADIANLAVTPDGRTLVTGNRAGSLAVWDVASGQLRRHVAIGPGRIEALAVAPDGGRVALVILGSGGAALSRWDLQTGLALPPLKGLQGQVLAVAYAHQSNQMITGGLDKTAQLWDAQTGAPGPVLAGHTSRIDAVAFSPDDRMVVTTSGDKTVRVWETASGHEIQAFPPGTIQAVARIALFTPDGRSVLAGGGSAPLSLWDVAAAPLLPHFPSGFPVALSPDEATLLGGGLAGPEAWDLRTGQPLKTALTGHPAAEWPAQFAADGRQVVLVEHAGPGAPGYVGQVRDTQTGTLVQRVPLPAIRGPAGRAPWAFAPDLGRVIQAAGGQAELRDRASGQVLHTFRDPGGPITDVAWAPDGTRVATLARTQAGGPDSSLRPAPPGPGEGGGNPADVPPGTGSSPPPAPATIRIWDAAGGQELRALSTTVDSSRVLLDLSPDGHWLLTGESPNAVTIWDLAGGTAAQHLVGHRGPIQDAHFSADSKRVVTASMDQTARLWDVAGGQELGRWTHAGGVVQAFLTANGKQLLTWSRDNIARFWYVNPSDAMDALCGRLVRDLTPDEREHYSITATDPTCPAR